jgi:hypothetical protein
VSSAESQGGNLSRPRKGSPLSTVPSTQKREDAFDRLLDAMPRIAEAVNAFDSKSTKRLAMEALIRTIGVPDQNGEADPPPTQVIDESAAAASDGGSVNNHSQKSEQGQENQPADHPTPARARKKKVAPNLQPSRDLDFWPAGAQSLSDLVAEKQPTTNDQKSALVVYWFEEISNLSEFGASHVLSAYKAMKWREPTDLVGSLRVTASRTHWINTSDMKALKITPGGRNLVNHELPAQPKAKKAA